MIRSDKFSLVKNGEPILLGKAVVFVKMVNDRQIDKIEKINDKSNSLVLNTSFQVLDYKRVNCPKGSVC